MNWPEVESFGFLLFYVRETLAAVKPTRGVILALIGTGLAAGLSILAWYRKKEPTYEDRTLSEWLKAYKTPIWSTGPRVSPEAADAVRHIGTNAWPFLVTWIQDQQQIPKWKEPLVRLIYRRKLGSPGRESLLELLTSRERRAQCAIWGFVILGETARPAIPDLVRIAHEGNTWSAGAATAALGYLGKDALPPLTSMVTNSAFPFRREAMVALGQMHDLGTNAHPAVVVLIHLLSDPGRAAGAADILGRLHVESDLCVPALAEFLSSTDSTMRMWAAISLGRFGTNARDTLHGLMKMLDDSDEDVRKETTNALRQIAPEVLQKTQSALRVGTGRKD